MLTESGLERLRSARRTHLAGIERYFLAPIAAADRDAIERGFSKVVAAIGPQGSEFAPAESDRADGLVSAGRVYAGTSGFSYPAWAPRFYPPGTRGGALLAALRHSPWRVRAQQHVLRASDRRAKIAAWTGAVPAGFRFVVKGQRGSTFRALFGDADEALTWLTEPLPGFGERLGAVLFRVDQRGWSAIDGRSATCSQHWPAAIPLVVEFQHPSWHVDETFAALRQAGAVLCATDLDELDEPPTFRRTGPFLYLRLRRSAYMEHDELDAWAARVAPFLVADGAMSTPSSATTRTGRSGGPRRGLSRSGSSGRLGARAEPFAGAPQGPCASPRAGRTRPAAAAPR